jgi:hypothetical protein
MACLSERFQFGASRGQEAFEFGGGIAGLFQLTRL